MLMQTWPWLYTFYADHNWLQMEYKENKSDTVENHLLLSVDYEHF